MTTTYTIEQIDAAEGASSTVHWRATNGAASVYGTVSIDGLTVTPTTTEADVVEKVKRALNAVGEQRDEHGNVVPPKPGEETAKTDALEAALAAQAAELASPKSKKIDLPWKHVA